MLPWLARPAEAARTAATVLRTLEAAEVARIEQLLVQCAREADVRVNEREYGPAKVPDDAECERVVRRENGRPVRRRMELGTMKHELAAACVQREIARLFPDNISIEPRYGLDPSTGRFVLTDKWAGSLRPDIVLHATGNPTQAQCIYDFKFPCSSASKSDPLASPEVLQQLEKYRQLGGRCPPAIVTPQLGINHG